MLWPLVAVKDGKCGASYVCGTQPTRLVPPQQLDREMSRWFNAGHSTEFSISLRAEATFSRFYAKNMRYLFLGGTCNNSRWRDEIIPHIDGFCTWCDPRTLVWNNRARELEEIERRKAEFCLFVFTPRMRGVYSIAQMTDESINRPKTSAFCILRSYDHSTFSNDSLQNLQQTAELWREFGSTELESLHVCIDWIRTIGNSHDDFARVYA